MNWSWDSMKAPLIRKFSQLINRQSRPHGNTLWDQNQKQEQPHRNLRPSTTHRKLQDYVVLLWLRGCKKQIDLLARKSESNNSREKQKKHHYCSILQKNEVNKKLITCNKDDDNDCRNSFEQDIIWSNLANSTQLTIISNFPSSLEQNKKLLDITAVTMINMYTS